MTCKLCGSELTGAGPYCRLCEQIESSAKPADPAREPGVIRLTIGPEDGDTPAAAASRAAGPTKSAECPECGHTIFKVIGPKFDEPHEHNMLIVMCTGCEFKGRMRWQGVARTTITIKAPGEPVDPMAANAPRN